MNKLKGVLILLSNFGKKKYYGKSDLKNQGLEGGYINFIFLKLF